jgi:hypothetical protein
LHYEGGIGISLLNVSAHWSNSKMIELQEQFDAMAIRDEERKKRKKAAKKLEEVSNLLLSTP